MFISLAAGSISGIRTLDLAIVIKLSRLSITKIACADLSTVLMLLLFGNLSVSEDLKRVFSLQ